MIQKVKLNLEYMTTAALFEISKRRSWDAVQTKTLDWMAPHLQKQHVFYFSLLLSLCLTTHSFIIQGYGNLLWKWNGNPFYRWCATYPMTWLLVERSYMTKRNWFFLLRFDLRLLLVYIVKFYRPLNLPNLFLSELYKNTNKKWLSKCFGTRLTWSCELCLLSFLVIMTSCSLIYCQIFECCQILVHSNFYVRNTVHAIEFNLILWGSRID